MKGMIIGIVVLIALIILAMLFFFWYGVREPPRSGREVERAVHELNSSAWQGWLVRDGAAAHAASAQ